MTTDVRSEIWEKRYRHEGEYPGEAVEFMVLLPHQPGRKLTGGYMILDIEKAKNTPDQLAELESVRREQSIEYLQELWEKS